VSGASDTSHFATTASRVPQSGAVPRSVELAARSKGQTRVSTPCRYTNRAVRTWFPPLATDKRRSGGLTADTDVTLFAEMMCLLRCRRLQADVRSLHRRCVVFRHRRVSCGFVGFATAEIAMHEMFGDLQVTEGSTWISLLVSVRSNAQSVILRKG
jgi:hypothetical protein